MNTHDDIASHWDALLSEGLVEPPADFQIRVMQQVQQSADVPARQPSLLTTVMSGLQAVAVIIGALAAGWQTLAFIFGLWATSIAA